MCGTSDDSSRRCRDAKEAATEQASRDSEPDGRFRVVPYESSPWGAVVAQLKSTAGSRAGPEEFDLVRPLSGCFTLKRCCGGDASWSEAQWSNDVRLGGFRYWCGVVPRTARGCVCPWLSHRLLLHQFHVRRTTGPTVAGNLSGSECSSFTLDATGFGICGRPAGIPTVSGPSRIKEILYVMD